MVSGGAQLRSWNQVTLPFTPTLWFAIDFGNDTFVAPGYGSTYAARSVDGGRSWSQVSLPASRNWTALANDGAGTWIAGADGTAAGARSTDDGATWSALTLPASGTLRCLKYGNGYFVAAWQGGTAAYRSNDGGTSWTSASVGTGKNWASIATDGAGKWVMLSGNNTTTGTRSSNDGQTWADTGTFTSESYYSLGYVRGYFVGLRNTAGGGIYSADGSAWSTFTFTGITTPAYPGVGQGVYVAAPGVSQSSGVVSYNATSAQTFTLPATFVGSQVAYGAGRFVMTVQSAVAYAYSADVLPRKASAVVQAVTRAAVF